MKVIFLGTCSGTEPMPGRKHTSFVVVYQEDVYWFDAGEGCSYTAHLAGVDLLRVRGIFISHPHMDHVGGLANLLWTMRKLEGRNEDPARSLSGKTVPLFIPNLGVWDGVRQVLGAPGHTWQPGFIVDAQTYEDGVIYNRGGLKVTALHNRHLGQPAEGKPWQSFSFRIEAGGKSLVFSGDVGDVRELAPLLDACDVLLMETGHHKVEDICAYLSGADHAPGRLVFVHHGRAVLADPEGERDKARAILGDRALVADDGMIMEV